MNDEEVAFRIVRLYFEEIARLGFKRSLDLDQMINSYFYTLKRLKEKDIALKALALKVVKEEKAKIESNVSSPKTESTVEKVSTTTTTVTNNKPKSQTIIDLLEKK